MTAGSEERVDRRVPAPYASGAVARSVWVITVLLSAAPAILFVEITGAVPVWLRTAQLAVATALLILTWSWARLRPLRHFAVVVIVLLLMLWWQSSVDLSWPPLQSALGGTAFDARMQGEQTAKLIVSTVLVIVLLLLGYDRRAMFLTAGRWAAPIRPVRLLGFPRPDPWWRFGLQWSLYVPAALAVALYLLTRPPGRAMADLLPMLPSIVLYAGLNAANEELTYRVPLLTTLEPVEGSTPALWQSSALFGIAHYFGIPGGLAGVALAVFMGWILGKAMVETRGLFWSWCIHFTSDLVIFVFLAAGLVGR